MVKNKTNSKINILFTGLIREPEKFRKSLQDFIAMRSEGIIKDIYFSTWFGEVEKSPEFNNFLKQNKVKIIKNKEPSPRGTFESPTIWCQMKALEEGLKKIDKNSFVLKTRTDVYINSKFLRKLFTQKETLLKIEKSLPKGNIFKHKVWIFYYELKTPFFMGEECFFGHKDDLKLLVNYENYIEEKYKVGGGISHIRRYIHPFIKDYKIFETFLEKYSKDSALKSLVEREKIMLKSDLYRKYFPHKYGLRAFLRRFRVLRNFNKWNKYKVLKNNLEKEDYIRLLAAYYSILYSHFYVDNVSFQNQVEFYGKKSANVDLDSSNLDANFSKDKIFASTAGGQIFGYDMKFLSNLANKKLAETPLTKKFYDAVDRFNNSAENK